MTDWLFYILSKTLGFVVKFDNALILMAVLGVFLSWKWQKISRLLLLVSVGSLLLLCFLPIGSILIEPLEKRFPMPSQLPQKIGGIIVLGGMESIAPSIIHQKPQFNASAERVMVLPSLLKLYPHTQVVIASGGYSTVNPEIKGAHIIAKWLRPLTPKTVSIHTELRSKNTYQNALYAQQYKDNDLPWLLVTSAWHMPRSVGVFRQLNWNVIAYPTDYKSFPLSLSPYFPHNIAVLRRASHEWIGLLAYYLNGYTNTLFPKP